MKPISLLLLALTAPPVFAAEPAPPVLRPLMVVPDRVILQDDFSKPGPLNKAQWQARQGTQWAVEDGVLRGRPSTAEYQAAKADHAGKEPRIASPTMPQDFAAQFSVRFSGGAETALVPLVEFGHHVCRVRFSEKITELLCAHDTLRVDEAKGFKYRPGTWYHLLAERLGDEVVVQIAGGPTLHAKHESIAEKPASGANGLGVAGPRDGMVEIDHVVISSVKPAPQPGWAAKRKSLPTYPPVTLEKKRRKAQ